MEAIIAAVLPSPSSCLGSSPLTSSGNSCDGQSSDSCGASGQQMAQSAAASCDTSVVAPRRLEVRGSSGYLKPTPLRIPAHAPERATGALAYQFVFDSQTGKPPMLVHGSQNELETKSPELRAFSDSLRYAGQSHEHVNPSPITEKFEWDLPASPDAS